MSDYPFIYIASLIRTGSTVLSESLTKLPEAFIFREPHFGKNYFRLKKDDIPRFGTRGPLLEKFPKWRLPVAFLLRRLRLFGFPQDFMVKEFKHQLIPLLAVKQIGVKEIKHRGWENYAKHFPDMKLVITGRDPRDIYISLYHRLRKGGATWNKPFTPQDVAQELLAQFNYQREMHEACDAMLVRYENLCTDETLLQRIKEFVKSPLEKEGVIGAFNKTHPNRTDEYYLHGGRLTDKRVERWREEANSQLVSESFELFHRMSIYTEFWGYAE